MPYSKTRRRVQSWRGVALGVLISLGVIVLLGARCPGGSGAFGSVLSVDDVDAVGSVGDDRLSLAEAIRLANGTLPLAALSSAERERVNGTPGAETPDHIRVVLGEGSVIQVADPGFPGEPALPYLVGNEGDLLDGGGVVLQETADPEPGERIGMVVLSSSVRVQRFELRGLGIGIVVVPLPFPAEITDVVIEGNVFRNCRQGVVANASPPGVAGTLRGLSIQWNEFFAPESAPDSIAVLGAGPQELGETITAAVVEGLSIRGNRIHGGFGGITVVAAVSAPTTSVEGASVRDVVVEGNLIEDVVDVSLHLDSGIAVSGGRVEGNTLEDVRVSWNLIRVGDTGATPIFAAGGLAFGSPGGQSRSNALRKLRVVANSLEGIHCFGIALHAGMVELTDAGHSFHNEISDVLILGNRVAGCENGIALIGGVAGASGGAVEGNTLREVLVALNRLEDNTQGVNLIGATGVEATTVPVPFDPVAAHAEQNRVLAIDISHNLVKRSQAAMVFTGGISFESPDVVVDNRVESVDLGRNLLLRNTWDCVSNDDIVIGDWGGVASGNAALVSCEAGFPSP